MTIPHVNQQLAGVTQRDSLKIFLRGQRWVPQDLLPTNSNKEIDTWIAHQDKKIRLKCSYWPIQNPNVQLKPLDL